jgi:DNA polymerase III subunit epsilon
MREVVFDTETTGLSPLNGDRLVEIGCIELVNRVETGEIFHCYFNPDRPMAAEAQAVHGLSDAFLADKPAFKDQVEVLLDFLGESPLVAHNASFDFSFLNFELEFCGRPKLAMARMVDTLALSRTKFPGAKHSLDAMCSRFGVDRSHRVLHGALLDAQLLSQVYVELTGGRQIGLGLADNAPVSSQSVFAMGRTSATGNRAPRAPRPHAPSDEERTRHQAFLEKLNDPIWATQEKAGDLVAIDEARTSA